MSQTPEWQQVRARKLEMIRLQNAQIIAGVVDPANGMTRKERRAYDAEMRRDAKRLLPTKTYRTSQVIVGDVYEMQRFEMPLKGSM
ncbi:hypothetical protein [Pelagibacterium luteolum]|uniref:Uncharacterized protein n=1 Tax=Pelagibacterium luteolum TaxID=440168 RepID=A0A1G7XHZ0_9HYPH|nr:hypothetical protein [Pelagibacterium luteolum]SDG83812.1 hypothetical protein SAMN04487974_109129 [Pelagibacterium luteolum]